MISLDTNVLVRWVMRDDPVQRDIADVIMARPFFVPISVFMEFGWVLRSVFGLTRVQIAEAAALVVNLPTANLPFFENLRWAIERYASEGDWEDMIHLATSNDADAFGTFEKRLARQAGPNTPVPIKNLNS